MNETCPKCGLQKELCVCETIAKESAKIRVMQVKRKFGKKYTIIEGVDDKDINLRELTKNLKSMLACGGTVKDSTIELQGDHRNSVKRFLVENGFAPKTIEIRG